MKKINYAFLTIVFLLQTLFVPISVAGGVLCVSESHVAVEFNKPADECHTESLSLAPILQLNQQLHQDVCRDIPLLQHEKNLLLKIKQQFKPVFSQYIISFLANIPDVLPLKSGPLTSKVFSALLFLQSTVLLI